MFLLALFFQLCLCEYFKVLLRSSDLFNKTGLAERAKWLLLTLERVYSIWIKCFPVQNPKRSCLISCVKSLLIFVCWNTKPFVCVSTVYALGLHNEMCTVANLCSFYFLITSLFSIWQSAWAALSVIFSFSPHSFMYSYSSSMVCSRARVWGPCRPGVNGITVSTLIWV